MRVDVLKQNRPLSRDACVEIITRAGLGCDHIGLATRSIDISQSSLDILRTIAGDILNAPKGSQVLRHLDPKAYVRQG